MQSLHVAGGGSTPSAGGVAVTTPSTTNSNSGNQTTPSTTNSNNGNQATTPSPSVVKSISVTFRNNTQNIGITYPDDPYGRGARSARNGLDLAGFKTAPTVAQVTGLVKMSGYIEANGISLLSSGQRLAGASTLEFNFANLNDASITGKATDFGIYAFSNNSPDGALCTAATCSLTKVRGVDGNMNINGNVSEGTKLSLSINGILTDKSSTGTNTYNFNGTSISGSINTNADNSALRATAIAPQTIKTSVDNGNQKTELIAFGGEWGTQ